MSTGYCDKCISGWVHKGTAKGKVKDIAGIETYVSTPDSPNGKNILYVTDIFGFSISNPRLLADQYAAEGYTVYVPNILRDDAFPAEQLLSIAPLPEVIKKTEKSLIDKNQQAAFEKLGIWFSNHPESEIDEYFSKIIPEINKSGPVFAVGFCWGGKQVFRLISKANNGIKGAVVLHPAGVTVDDVKFTVPVALGYGSLDTLFNNGTAENVKKAILELNKSNEVKVFEGQVHGFAVRGDLNDKDTRLGNEDAKRFTLDFFNKL